jgi:hypothetical protein
MRLAVFTAAPCQIRVRIARKAGCGKVARELAPSGILARIVELDPAGVLIIGRCRSIAAACLGLATVAARM